MIKALEVDGFPVEYFDEAGPSPESPTVVLLSGWGQDHRLYRHVAPLLQEHFRVIRMNYRGHDLAQTRGDFTSEDLSHDVVKLVEALELGKFFVVSHSHGCWVSLRAHELLGDRAPRRAVLIDWRVFDVSILLEQFQDVTQNMHDARRAIFKEWLADTDNLDVIDHVLREMPWFNDEIWERSFREIAANYQRWPSPLLRAGELSGTQILHLYSQPSTLDYQSQQTHFATQNPWFHPVFVPGRTHFALLENPQVLAEQIASFLLDD